MSGAYPEAAMLASALPLETLSPLEDDALAAPELLEKEGVASVERRQKLFWFYETMD